MTRYRRDRGRDIGGLPGVTLAGITAAVSGVSVWINSYGVHAVHSPAVYTTAKNSVAAVLLLVVGAASWLSARARAAEAGSHFGAGGPPSDGGPVTGPPSRVNGRVGRPLATVGAVLALLYVGAVGGGVAFVLFFNGLAQTSAASAAFWRDTLVIWVAVMAVPILRERLQWWNLAAIAVLIAGQVLFAGGIGRLAADRGQLLVLASSLLWGVEAVVIKVLVRAMSPRAVGAARMAVGALLLVVYLLATGRFGELAALDRHQMLWVVLTGAWLAVYVSTWMAALARARAVDVTSILVGSALVTWLLQAASGTTVASPRSIGLVLIAAGAGAVAWSAARQESRGRLPAS